MQHAAFVQQLCALRSMQFPNHDIRVYMHTHIHRRPELFSNLERNNALFHSDIICFDEYDELYFFRYYWCRRDYCTCHVHNFVTVKHFQPAIYFLPENCCSPDHKFIVKYRCQKCWALARCCAKLIECNNHGWKQKSHLAYPLRLSAAWEINNLKLSIAKITGNPS